MFLYQITKEEDFPSAQCIAIYLLLDSFFVSKSFQKTRFYHTIYHTIYHNKFRNSFVCFTLNLLVQGVCDFLHVCIGKV